MTIKAVVKDGKTIRYKGKIYHASEAIELEDDEAKTLMAYISPAPLPIPKEAKKEKKEKKGKSKP